MKTKITVREAMTEQDVQTFWEQMHIYHARDIFPEPSEDLNYFLNDAEYRAQIQACHDRAQNRCYYLFFTWNGQNVGFTLPAIFDAEDGKCFILEFCVFPEFRGNGMGRDCAEALLAWAWGHGANYAELNYGNCERRRRFWQGIGFRVNGVDEWGNPLMMLPPKEELPVTVERLLEPTDWQLLKLENGFLTEIGESILSEMQQESLQQAVKDGKITFFLAKRGYRAIGMCSVATTFSTFSCADTGVFDDFFVEPMFRKKGIARQLACTAQQWCKQQKIVSLTVCCAPCDAEMYQSLGFETQLGTTYACLQG